MPIPPETYLSCFKRMLELCDLAFRVGDELIAEAADG